MEKKTFHYKKKTFLHGILIKSKVKDSKLYVTFSSQVACN